MKKKSLILAMGAMCSVFGSTAAFGQSVENIVGMSISCTTDKVFTWWDDGSVTIGTSSDLTKYQPLLPKTSYSLPPGMTTSDIVGIGITKYDQVIAWYRDGTVSKGTSTDLDSRESRYGYSLPPDYTPNMIIGIDVACSNDHVYVWYNNSAASSGTSDNLDYYESPYPYSLPVYRGPGQVVDMGIARNDRVYAWYRDYTVSAGTSSDLDRYLLPYWYDIE